jgi:hypothetical protein
MTKLSTTSIAEKIDAYGGVPVLPHPLAVYPKKSYMLLKDKQFLKKIKAIESHNFGLGRYLRTRKAVEKFRKPLTAGSDSHTISWFNTLTGSSFDAGSFLDSVIKGKNMIYCRNNHYAWRMLEQFAMLRNNIQTTMLLKQAKAKNIS